MQLDAKSLLCPNAIFGGSKIAPSCLFSMIFFAVDPEF